MRCEIVLLLLLLINFSSAVEVKEFNCPNQSYFNHDFFCTLNIEEVSGLYDLKVYIKGNDSGINKIWGDKGWTRADWYLKSVVNKDGIYEIKILIDKDFSGVAQGILRLRESGSSYSFYEEDFIIQIGDFEEDSSEGKLENNTNQTTTPEVAENNETNLNESEQINLTDDSESNEEIILTEPTEEEPLTEKEVIYLGNSILKENEEPETPKKVINLNSDISSEKETEVVYESKSEKSRRYGLYTFFGFLSIAFVYLLIDKLKHGNRNYDY